MWSTQIASKFNAIHLPYLLFPLSLTCLCLSAYWHYNRKSKQENITHIMSKYNETNMIMHNKWLTIYNLGSCSFALTMMNKQNSVVISQTYDSYSFQNV